MGKIVIGVIVVAALAGFWLMKQSDKEAAMDHAMDMGGAVMDKAESQVNSAVENAKKMGTAAKEFTMTSYYDDKGAWFSMKEVRVKKGDLVRIKVTNTKGTHDFVIDAYGVKQETPLNQEVVVEFVADKTGEFEYYCSKPGHRARGQFGKLIVE